MNKQQIAFDFFEELLVIYQHKRLNPEEKYELLADLLGRICKDKTQKVNLQFSNLFSRIVFLSHQYNLSAKQQWELHHLRKTSYLVSTQKYPIKKRGLSNAFKSLGDIISAFYQISPPRALQKLNGDTDSHPSPIFPRKENTISKLRVQLIKKVKEEDILICKAEDNKEKEPIRVKYNQTFRNGSPGNQEFNASIDGIREGAQLNLIDVTIDSEGYFIPTLFVLEPDYLLDISAIAECYQGKGINPSLHLKRKFDINPKTPSILLGNLANFFLDELIHEDTDKPLHFNDLFPQAFQLYPMEFTTMEELIPLDAFKEFQQSAFSHFRNIRRVLNEDFQKGDHQIHKKDCALEPSFYSERYGLQGRLDILHQPQDPKNALGIIELKSSRSAPTNGTWKNHMAQGLLYRLLLQEVFPEQVEKTNPTIFYSSPNHQNLRFTPALLQEEKELINLRNLIIITEQKLAYAQSFREILEPLKALNSKNFEKEPEFIKENVREFEDAFYRAPKIEQKFFLTFVNFIAREHLLAKIGDSQYETDHGLAGLWQKSFKEKQEGFQILFDLKIEENAIDKEKPYILFSRTNPNNQFVNFREGDIGVLYPRDTMDDHVLKNQAIKCSIASISKDQVKVGFRYKQRNKKYFKQFSHWAIEHDFMDTGFYSMYRSLFSFLQAKDQKKKDKILGKTPPISPIPKTFQGLSPEQNRIIGKALTAPDYFLLCGPPGTGKTSIMLKTLVKELHQKPGQNILLLAYTNRAVDEICEAVDGAIEASIDPKRKFIRIGSELSTASQFRHTLLNKVAEEASSRKELKEYLQSHRIFIGTLASLSGKSELFQLKKFQVGIVDEASQILEPQVIGLLNQLDKFILIGDHKQLPAIALQNPEHSTVNDPDLNQIGLINRSFSYFERMFRLCQRHNWHWAYDMLTHQGRMHRELATFANHAFYGGKLQLIPAPWQEAKLHIENVNKQIRLEEVMASRRLVFIPSDNHSEDKSPKVNSFEARLTAQLVAAIIQLKERNQNSNSSSFSPAKSIGIITPFRNQAAHIRMELEKHKIKEHDQIVVDTVERYQGSQRDIIIISFCINQPHQLRSLTSEVWDEADQTIIDRKLNVSITRARQQMVFLGNEGILSRNPIYSKLIDWVRSNGGYIKV
ncbi:AAA domain-containing protein [Xanthovirga aplysinae]|uniref:AAA domain-containing protein n=1 Tax=Xanthovirga aplysinae TaxID=2529853 RepID=UPI0012BC10BA|nr:AAA domain-containing protein [Xanthovirga aplysinae]MTI33461.1 hypothetical protein [Xanthovirga aplysinae]